jgi:hypothetical protein
MEQGLILLKLLKSYIALFFLRKRKEKRHLKHFIKGKGGEESFTMHNLSGILGEAGSNAKDVFEKLHSLCFSDKGKRTELLDDFCSVDFKPGSLSSALCGGVRASSNFKKLHSLCFNEEREKTEPLDDFCKAGFRRGDLCSMLSGAVDSASEESRVYTRYGGRH